MPCIRCHPDGGDGNGEVSGTNASPTCATRSVPYARPSIRPVDQSRIQCVTSGVTGSQVLPAKRKSDEGTAVRAKITPADVCRTSPLGRTDGERGNSV